ncbi:MAG: RNA polymerase factor sigma-32 [Pseudomonadota bacterium]
MSVTANRLTALTVRDGLDLYFRELHKVSVLSRAEERRLADRWYETRDREAGRVLVLSNLRFVAKIAQEYARYGLRLADLIQEGNLGLLHAVDRFDPRKGYRLITYAVWWIRAYIQAFILRSWSIVRTGTTRIQRRIFSGLQRARQKIAAMTGASEAPTNRQLADVLSVSEDDLKDTVSRMQQRDVSIDQPVTLDGDRVFGDTLADETPNAEARLIASDLQMKVREKMDEVYEDLSPRERYLVEHRLLAETPITLETVGRQFGVTRERVRQLESRLKGKLRLAFAPVA